MLSLVDELAMFWGLVACVRRLGVRVVWSDGCGVCCVLEYEWSLSACYALVVVVHWYRLGVDPTLSIGGVEG